MNPFIYSGASNLTEKQVIDVFVHDHNYSRFIQSQRNVFIWGERGSGKTMTLLYNRIKMKQMLGDEVNAENRPAYVPVYIPCITPLVFKREYLLLENEFKASVISEHYLVLSIALSLVNTLIEINDILEINSTSEFTDEISYILDDDLPDHGNILQKLRSYFRKEFIRTQKEINRSESDSFFHDTYTFSSLMLPIMEILKELPKLSNAHYVFMLDDAHDLNKHQRSILNTWIAYRDNSSFSFKISAAKIADYDLSTNTGGAILEGHDYIAIDLEKPYQNDESSFGNLAKKVIRRRLTLSEINVDAGNFFPQSEAMSKDLKKCKEQAKQEAIKKFGVSNGKQITDYIYKYSRAIYFRSRNSKANRPQYSGLETITHLSSGVIRNLLEPCYWMYEDMLSKTEDASKITVIPSNVQADVIRRLSLGQWDRIRDGIDKELIDCSKKQAQQLSNLISALADLFRKRLLDKDCSEPRAIAFTISAKSKELMKKIIPILTIARRAQLLYWRSGSAKDDGATEYYYTLNRMLWPSRGLDPVGQHARVSIQAKCLLGAINGERIPYKDKTQQESVGVQDDIFNT